MTQRNRIVLIHASFWCVYLSFFIYQISFYQRDEPNWGRLFTVAAIQLFFTSATAYLNYFVFLPRFQQHRNVGRYLLEFLLPFALLIVARLYTERFLIDGFTHEEKYLYRTRFVVNVTLVTLFITIFVGMLRFAAEWFELEAKKRAVENERLSAELRFLKAQINPHFLFNTLNNLYYLAFTQSPNTTEVIAKLSQMMRYMIYDSNHPRVRLEKEIEYMQNYISLEKLRLNEQIPIRFEVRGEPGHVLIAPLILITFLENAFKHGVSNNFAEAWVDVQLEINGNVCTYTVENSKLPEQALKEEKSGIGLQNVRRRLELSYPNQYDLRISDHPDHYRIELKLNVEGNTNSIQNLEFRMMNSQT
ncbi:MAG: histidine kinase [Cytophagales bacterium]|jgi:hypothetical protein|nr:histidine kinase [Cytophagales bacterium]